MNDEVLTIKLTETEIIHIMDSLRMRCQDLRDCDDAETTDLANELEELEHDLFEALARPGDWTEDVEPTEIAEDVMFNAGVAAREQVKRDEQQRFGEFDVGTSKAAERRNERMMRGTTATLANDPVDW